MNISISCPINNTGYGIVSTNIIKELVNANKNISLFPIGSPQVSNRVDYDIIENLLKNKYNNFNPDAAYIKIWHQFDLFTRIGKGKYFAFPFFELDTFNDVEKLSLSVPDCIVVPTKWAKDIIEDNGIKTTTVVVPLGVDQSIFNATNIPALSFKDPNKYVFLNIGKWEIRKGHDILVELFNTAFPYEKDVELWLLASENTNSYSTAEEIEKWKAKYDNPRIRLFTGADSQKDIATLMGNCDCGIYPSRAEGWNLEALETMAMNRPVITTNYSGHTEFCNDQNSFLVDISDKEPAYDGKAFNRQGNWAKISQKEKNQFIDIMRYVYKNRINTNENGIKTAKEYSWPNTVEKLVRCIS